MAEFKSKIRTIQWVDNVSRMVDQTLFPYEFKYVDIKTGQEMFDAIKTMIVRGAPAIGIAGAHGVVLYAQELAKENLSRDEFIKKLLEKADYMAISRPTAVNLMWAVKKQKEIIQNSKSDINGLIEELKQKENFVKHEAIAGRLFRYMAAISRMDYEKREQSSFLNRFFNGSHMEFVRHLIKEEKISKEDLEELIDFINKD